MTPEEQNIAIAESLGWVNIMGPDNDSYQFLRHFERHPTLPSGRNLVFYPDGIHHPIPNYHGSLDACREILEYINYEQGRRLAERLWSKAVTDYGDQFDDYLQLIKTTSSSLCEEYLKVINKWERTP